VTVVRRLRERSRRRIPIDTPEFWTRLGIVMVLAALVSGMMRSAMVTCTAISVCIAGLASGFIVDEQQGIMVIVIGLTVGPIAGIIVDAVRTRDRRLQSVVGRRFARSYTCSHCGHAFSTVQKTARCPRCERPVV